VTGADVLAERRGRVVVLTLNRPERLNAVTPAMHGRYLSLLAEAAGDPDVGAIVVTGAGRGFCAGADADAVAETAERAAGLARRAGARRRPGAATHPAFGRPWVHHLGVPKPIVAAVNGPAAGLGLVLACCCDVRFAAEGATLAPAFGPLGLPPEFGLAWLLPRLIGGARATEWLLSSRVVLAEEAREMGLVHRVAPPGRVVDEAVAWAEDVVARCGPDALAHAKRLLHTGWMTDLASAFDEARELTDAAVRGPEFAEGVAARRERRHPRWPRRSAG
jgi:enoyl-CoA hydratase/carnithine racemase